MGVMDRRNKPGRSRQPHGKATLAMVAERERKRETGMGMMDRRNKSGRSRQSHGKATSAMVAVVKKKKKPPRTHLFLAANSQEV